MLNGLLWLIQFRSYYILVCQKVPIHLLFGTKCLQAQLRNRLC
jgi:hypothetical protein